MLSASLQRSTSAELTSSLEKLASRPDADSHARALQKLRQDLAAEKAAALEQQRRELETKARLRLGCASGVWITGEWNSVWGVLTSLLGVSSKRGVFERST